MSTIPFTPANRAPVNPAYLTWGGDDGGPANVQRFDVVFSEAHTHMAQVTEHSVEEGVAIVDHVRPLPDELELNVFVSDTPVFSNDSDLLPMTLLLPKRQQDNLVTGLTAARNPGPGGPSTLFAGGTSQLIQDGLQALGITKGPPTSLTVLVQQFDADHPYVQNCHDTLVMLRDTATLLSVHTPQAHYNNMVVKQVVMNRSKEYGSSGASFAISLRQIRIVQSQITVAPLPSTPAAAPAQPKGKQDTAPATDNDKRSVAAKAQDQGQNPNLFVGALGKALGGG